VSEKARLALELTLNGASNVIGAMRGVTGATSSFLGTLGGANQQMFFLLSNMRSFASAGAQAASALIAPSKETEGWEEQLSFLLKSADAAKSKLGELFKTANDSGMKMQPMVDLYFNLQRVSQGALTGDDDMKLWVRSAKLTGQAAGQMGQQVADMWAALERGESPDKGLKSLGSSLISPAAFKEITALAESGASAEAVFAAIRQEMQRTTSNVDRAAQTFGDLETRLGNYFFEAKRIAGTGLFDSLKDDLTGLDKSITALFESGRAQKWANGLSSQIQGAFEKAKKASLGGVTFDDIIASLDNGTTGTLLGEMFSVAADNFWKTMAYGAKTYGPEISKAIIPEKLHGLLGLDRQTDMARIARGEITQADLNKYGSEIVDNKYLDWSKYFMRGLMLPASPLLAAVPNDRLGTLMPGGWSDMPTDERKALLQQFAQSQGAPTLNLSQIDPGMKLGLTDPALMQRIAEMQMNFGSQSIGTMRFAGATYADASGNRNFIPQEFVASELKKLLAETTDSAKALNRAAGYLEKAAEKGATF
jgi:hypothetical protein